jgi:hypothetical protein
MTAERRAGPLGEIDDVLEDLETLLKNPEVGAALADKGVNTSLAMLGMDGLAAYLRGDKAKAVEDSTHFAEEVDSRMRASAKDKPS